LLTGTPISPFQRFYENRESGELLECMPFLQYLSLLDNSTYTALIIIANHIENWED
jgi:hypothetical protein